MAAACQGLVVLTLVGCGGRGGCAGCGRCGRGGGCGGCGASQGVLASGTCAGRPGPAGSPASELPCTHNPPPVPAETQKRGAFWGGGGPGGGAGVAGEGVGGEAPSGADASGPVDSGTGEVVSALGGSRALRGGSEVALLFHSTNCGGSEAGARRVLGGSEAGPFCTPSSREKQQFKLVWGLSSRTGCGN